MEFFVLRTTPWPADFALERPLKYFPFLWSCKAFHFTAVALLIYENVFNTKEYAEKSVALRV